MQFYAECWSGENAGKTFAKDGPTDKCYEGVGKRKANAVYRIENIPRELLTSNAVFIEPFDAAN